MNRHRVATTRSASVPGPAASRRNPRLILALLLLVATCGGALAESRMVQSPLLERRFPAADGNLGEVLVDPPSAAVPGRAPRPRRYGVVRRRPR